jgi:hypothetical protein
MYLDISLDLDSFSPRLDVHYYYNVLSILRRLASGRAVSQGHSGTMALLECFMAPKDDYTSLMCIPLWHEESIALRVARTHAHAERIIVDMVEN